MKSYEFNGDKIIVPEEILDKNSFTIDKWNKK